jgi:hypothetical protein
MTVTALARKRLAGWLVAMIAVAAVAWTAADEPKAEPAAEPAAFEVVLLSLKGDWQAMRYHAQSGEAWYAYQGNWKPVPEADNTKPPAGDYRIQMSPTGDNDWIAIRLERKSGRTWRLAALKWAEMKVLEPEKPKQGSELEL